MFMFLTPWGNGGGGGWVGRKRKWEDEMEGVARGMKNNSQFFPFSRKIKETAETKTSIKGV